jgi:hypothetical protein
MNYKITSRQIANAMLLGVTIKPSKNPDKKIDVFLKGKKIASIGATGYKDYDYYLKTKSKAYADERRRLYKLRHQSDRMKKNSPGFYADKILW